MNKFGFSKWIGVFIALVFVSSIAFAATVEVSSANYSPAPVVPGQYFDLFVHVKNNSNAVAENALFKLNLNGQGVESSFPFYLDTAESDTKELGTINAYQTVLVKFRILTDPGALDGVYSITFESGGNGTLDKSEAFSISVVNRKPVIRIISSSPDSASTGQTTDLKLVLKNTGTSPAYNISVGVKEDRTITGTGTVVERDIIPLGIATVFISELNPGESTEVSIPLLVNPAITSKAYFVPVKIDFLDGNKTQYSDTSYIGLKVSDDPEIGVIFSGATPLPSPGAKTSLEFELYNNGSGDAKFLIATLTDSESISVEKKENFIGTLEPDDFDSLTVDVKINDVKPGTYPVELLVSYKNQFGDTKSVKKTVDLKVYSKEEAVANGNAEGIPWFVLLIALVVLAAGVYVFIKRKKKKQQ